MPLYCTSGQPRCPCWTMCETHSQSKKSAASGSGTENCGLTATAAVSRCRTASLRISIGGDDYDAFSANNLALSPVSSPSFSFDSVCDMFAAMDSPTNGGGLITMLKSPQTGAFPLDDGFSALNTRVSVLSPTTKRPRKSTNASSASSGSNTSTVSSSSSSSATSRVSSRTSGRRYTSILLRCLPRNLKSSITTSNNNRDHYHEVTSESPSYRATDTAPFCSTLTSSSPARKRFGTVLLNDDHQDLHHLFRDEAEYSDYLSALVTGAHSQMDAVVFYELEVHLSQMQWKLYRRFSEFRALRQDLIKHFSKRLRQQQSTSNSASASSKCEICAHMLAAIEQSAFPSRQQMHCHWHKLFKSSSSSSTSEVDQVDSPTASAATRFSTETVIADRKAKFGEFVALCLRTMRGLRQHGKVMEDSSACEIGTALRLIEEFFGLSFTRYLRFLSERGVVSDANSTKGTKQQQQNSGSAFTTGGRRRLTAVI